MDSTDIKKIFKTILFITFILLIIISLTYIIHYLYIMHNINKESKLLNNIIENTNIIAEEPGSIENNDEEISKTERMLKLEELQKDNSDIVAWIEIENTNINYPVLQCSNNDFYMNHNYKKEYSIGGSIFLDKDYDWNLPSSNLLIYGHNLKNGTMFNNLLKYQNKKFFESHPTIRFTTNKEDTTYEIIATFKSKLYYKTDTNVFRYYYFINASNESDYNNFVTNAKKASLYDTGKTAKYGDSLMTLSTCAYHTKDGRFAVVARKTQ